MRPTMIAALVLTVVLALVPWPPAPATAQAPGELEQLKKDVEALKAGQLGIQREIQELRTLLRRQQPGSAQPVVLGVDGHPVMGTKDARVTVVEFSDYQCPFCGRHFRDTLPRLEREYIETGKVRYVFRNFPLEQIHPQAFAAAEAAACAGEQGKYWEMHDQLFRNQAALGHDDLLRYARTLQLDAAAFEECLAKDKFATLIRQDLSDGQQAGARGTPTFFLGVTEGAGSSLKAVKTIQGAQPYAVFKDAIDRLLTGTE